MYSRWSNKKKKDGLSFKINANGRSLNYSFNPDSYDQTDNLSIITLDEWFNENQLDSIDLIRIDLDGYEWKVLQGGAETISKFTPILFIQIAKTFKARGYKNKYFHLTLEWLKEKGYQLRRVNSNGKLSIV